MTRRSDGLQRPPVGRSPMMGWRYGFDRELAFRRRARAEAAADRRRALPSPASVSSPHARREAQSRAGPSLGPQSLLLSGSDSREGRILGRALTDAGTKAGMATTHHRP